MDRLDLQQHVVVDLQQHDVVDVVGVRVRLHEEKEEVEDGSIYKENEDRSSELSIRNILSNSPPSSPPPPPSFN